MADEGRPRGGKELAPMLAAAAAYRASCAWYSGSASGLQNLCFILRGYKKYISRTHKAMEDFE